ncbi:hypothetical protein GCM10023085_07740 [Actinomadura viridis]|uniref:Secreted protein n=1 Tax=Actinomadura viridis TaxID=58110 RepID=A0A931DNG4_9ACTN|nr:hypothetical protein [Actinomadura viridis]MBG6091783.1 hypothetical protein [Actinomadura viridis]
MKAQRFGVLAASATALVLAAGGTAAAAPAAPRAVRAGNAPQCIHTNAWESGVWSYQRATNHCGRAYRIKLIWTVASSHCFTLQPGSSVTWKVFRPAWANGANLC